MAIDLEDELMLARDPDNRDAPSDDGAAARPHGSFFGMKDKLAKLQAGAKPSPFVDPQGCRAFFAKAEAAFDQRLAQCKADPACGKKEDQ